MWSLMADAESPQTIFELIYTRFPDNAHMRIMYDNACNAHHYFLNREAEYSRDLQFYIDYFHFKGHKNCSLAYGTGADF